MCTEDQNFQENQPLLPVRVFYFLSLAFYIALCIIMGMILCYIFFDLFTNELVELGMVLIEVVKMPSELGGALKTWLGILIIAATVIMGDSDGVPAWRFFMFVIMFFCGLCVFLFFNDNLTALDIIQNNKHETASSDIISVSFILKSFALFFSAISFSIAFSRVLLKYTAEILKSTVAVVFIIIIFSPVEAAFALEISINSADKQAELSVKDIRTAITEEFNVNSDNHPQHFVNINGASPHIPLLASYKDNDRKIEFYIYTFGQNDDKDVIRFKASEYTVEAHVKDILSDYKNIIQFNEEKLRPDSNKVITTRMELKYHLFQNKFIDIYTIIESYMSKKTNTDIANALYIVYLDLVHAYNSIDVLIEHRGKPRSIVIPKNYHRVHKLVKARIAQEYEQSKVKFLNKINKILDIGEMDINSIMTKVDTFCGIGLTENITYLHNYWRFIVSEKDSKRAMSSKENLYNMCNCNANKSQVSIEKYLSNMKIPDERENLALDNACDNDEIIKDMIIKEMLE